MRRNISLNLYTFSEREQFISQTFTYLILRFTFRFAYGIATGRKYLNMENAINA